MRRDGLRKEEYFGNLTVVIPTYNRFAYLERALKYYLSFFPGGNIIVLDSSFDEPSQGPLKEMLGKVVYKRFPADLFLGSKIAQGLKEVRTQYAVLSADDDFLFPDALKQALDYLSMHDDYSCVHGDSLYHTLEEVDGKWEFRAWPLRFGFPSIEDTSCGIRLKKFFPSHYEGQVFYAVYRTKTLQQIWSMTARGKLYWCLFEIVSVCQAFIYGKVKSLPVFYVSREINFYEKTVPKLKFLNVGAKGQEILNDLIKKGILVEISPMDVRLKEHVELKQELIREIAKDDFDEIWSILQKSFKLWYNDDLLEEWYLPQRISSAVRILLEALAGQGDSSLSRDTIEKMFREFRQLEKKAAKPKTLIAKALFKFGHHFRFKRIRKALATDQDMQRLREAVLTAHIDTRQLDVSRMTYLENNTF